MNTKFSTLSDSSYPIVFITGGTKSGKSEYAEHLAKKIKKLSYVALSKKNTDDKEWQNKIAQAKQNIETNIGELRDLDSEIKMNQSRFKELQKKKEDVQ